MCHQQPTILNVIIVGLVVEKRRGFIFSQLLLRLFRLLEHGVDDRVVIKTLQGSPSAGSLHAY